VIQKVLDLSSETTFFLDPLSSLDLLLFNLESRELVLLSPFLIITIESILDLTTIPFTNGVRSQPVFF